MARENVNPDMDLQKVSINNPATKRNAPAGNKRSEEVNPDMDLSESNGMNHAGMMDETQGPIQPGSPLGNKTGKDASAGIQAAEGGKSSAGNPQKPTATAGNKRAEGVNPDMDLQKA